MLAQHAFQMLLTINLPLGIQVQSVHGAGQHTSKIPLDLGHDMGSHTSDRCVPPTVVYNIISTGRTNVELGSNN